MKYNRIQKLWLIRLAVKKVYDKIIMVLFVMFIGSYWTFAEIPVMHKYNRVKYKGDRNIMKMIWRMLRFYLLLIGITILNVAVIIGFVYLFINLISRINFQLPVYYS